MRKPFFEWIIEVCRLLGKDKKYGVLLVSDKNWFFAYDDGFTEEQAIKEWRQMYPDGYTKEIEDEYLNNQNIA